MYKLILGFLLVIFIVILQVNAANTNATELDDLVTQWTQLEQQYSEIDNRWQENKPLLEQQLRLFKEERKLLEGTLEQHVTANDEVEKERFDLLQQQTQMEEIQQLMEFELTKISSVLVNIHQQLPPPLKQQWDADIALLSGAKESSSPHHLIETDTLKQAMSLLNNSEKLETLLNLLNSVEQFEQRVGLHQTTMQVVGHLSESKVVEIQVDQVYLGLSQGWYISKDGKYWGTGNSQLQGWQWQHQSADVEVSELRQTVKMLTDPAVAALVTLPIKLSKRQSDSQ